MTLDTKRGVCFNDSIEVPFCASKFFVEDAEQLAWFDSVQKSVILNKCSWECIIKSTITMDSIYGGRWYICEEGEFNVKCCNEEAHNEAWQMTNGDYT